MNDRNLSKDSTIYNYRLLKRIRYSPFWTFSHLGALLGFYVFDIIRLDPFRFPASLAVMALLHHLLMHLLFIMKEEYNPDFWFLRFRFPWFGMAPDNYCPLSKCRQLGIQLLWIPFLLAVCIYPWISLSSIIHLAIAHIWLVLPRLALLYRLRKHSKIGLIKIGVQEISCYTQ